MKSIICKIGFLPDVHIGKPRLQPQRLHEHLSTLVYPRIQELDMLVFGGDFFDSALSMNSDAGLHAAMIIDDILTLATKHKTFVRVVTGTFFHDRYQNRMFEIKADRCGLIDGVPLLSVFDKITYEYIKPLRLSMVYCPDNQVGDITVQLLGLLKSHKLDKIDFLCSHGYYDIMLPRGITHKPPNLINYTAISPRIRGYILNGHIHIPNVKDKLISGGSFERLSHGEEHDKGYYIVNYDPITGNKSYEFIVNEMTNEFITINLANYLSVEDCLSHINNIMTSILLKKKGPIHIRLDGLSSTDNFIIHTLNDTHGNDIVVTIKSNTPEDIAYKLEEVIQTLPIISEDNLPELVFENIKNDDITLEQIKEFINDK